MNRYDSMYWTKDDLPDEVFTELRLQGIVHTGLLIRDAWVERNGEIGLPRAYAQQRGYRGSNQTILPKLDWPVGRLDYRYNQREVISCAHERLLADFGCLISAPPGFGKTVVSLEVASKFHTPTLVLVNKEDLIDQWKNTAKQFYGLEAGHVQEDKLDYEKRHVTIATVQTLSSRLEKLPRDFWTTFGFVICDEGHRMPCDTFVRVISELPARFRMGVSATWRRKDGMERMWDFHIGSQICVGEKSDVPFRYQKITIQSDLSDRDFYQRGEINHVKCLTAIARNEGYNQWLAEQIVNGIKTRNILLVSHRLEQIERLDSILRSRGIHPGIYVGTYKGKKVTPEQLAEAAKSRIILATVKKIEEGSDLPRLDTLILATPLTDPEQVAGRIGRSYPGKDFALIIDPVIQSFYNEALYRKREFHYTRLGFIKL